MVTKVVTNAKTSVKSISNFVSSFNSSIKRNDKIEHFCCYLHKLAPDQQCFRTETNKVNSFKSAKHICLKKSCWKILFLIWQSLVSPYTSVSAKGEHRGIEGGGNKSKPSQKCFKISFIKIAIWRKIYWPLPLQKAKL